MKCGRERKREGAVAAGKKSSLLAKEKQKDQDEMGLQTIWK